MVAYNFQARFGDLVEQGRKRQTIRAERKRPHARPGDALQLYTGMRTRHCRKLLEARCTAVTGVEINRDSRGPVLRLDGEAINRVGAENLARNDGFSSLDDMVDWFEQHHGLPFRGVCIQW